MRVYIYQIIITFPKLIIRCPAGDSPCTMWDCNKRLVSLVTFSLSKIYGRCLLPALSLSFFNLSLLPFFPLSRLWGLLQISLHMALLFLVTNFAIIALIFSFLTLLFFVFHTVPPHVSSLLRLIRLECVLDFFLLPYFG